MDSDTSARLIELNRQFYQSFAAAFSETRRRLQPGVRRLLRDLPAQADILDLGCGNGGLWKELQKRGHAGNYFGVDFSLPMLYEAVSTDPQIQVIEQPVSASNIDTAVEKERACFIEADICISGWEAPLAGRKFGLVVGFACLHHIPGEAARASLLTSVSRLLAPGGRFWLSAWQFLNSQRLVRRLQPWELAGLNPDQVEAGDHLLDWKHKGCGLRYVHHFSEQELGRLAETHGFQVEQAFYSDGESGKLGLYEIWRKQG